MVTRRRTASTEELRELARELEDALVAGVDQAKAWLDSPRGRRARDLTARALIFAAPVIMKHPIFKTPLGRVVQVAGGAALLTKMAEVIRDWEPAVATTAARPE